MRQVNTCVICGNQFWTSRVHSQTCTPKCRSKLHRQRKSIEAEVSAEQMTMDEWSDLKQIENCDMEASRLLRRLYKLHGHEAFTMALEAMRLVALVIKQG